MHRSVDSVSLGIYVPINIDLRNAEMDILFTIGMFFYISNHLCGTDVASDKQATQQNLRRQKQFSLSDMYSPETILHGLME